MLPCTKSASGRKLDDRSRGRRSAAALVAAPGGGGQPDRHDHRVVRLLPLRHRCGAGVRQAVLSGEGSAHRPLAGLPHLFAGLRGAADRRAGVRPLRRPDRQEASLDGEPRADGRGQHGDGPFAHLPADRRRRAGAAGGPEIRAGFRRRRRVGRRGADGRRVRRRHAPRRLVRLAAGRRAGRQPAGGRRAGGDGGAPERSGLPRLGLARGVPALRPAGRGRLVGALDLERVAAIRGGRGASRAGDRAGAARFRR